MILILLAIIAIVLCVLRIVFIRLSKHVFQCHHCKQTFSPNYKELMFGVHVLDEYMLKCPYCHEKNYCTDLGKKNKNL